MFYVCNYQYYYYIIAKDPNEWLTKVRGTRVYFLEVELKFQGLRGPQ